VSALEEQKMPNFEMPLDEAGARRLTDEIRERLDWLQEDAEALVRLIEQADQREAWKLLGYSSWPAYVAAEFTNARRDLDPETRVDLVAKLAGLGMSTRAIAPVVGVGKSTVARDLAGVPDGTRPDYVVIGLDGRRYPYTVHDIEDEPVPYVVDGRVPYVTKSGSPPRMNSWCGETIPWGRTGRKVLNFIHRAMPEIRQSVIYLRYIGEGKYPADPSPANAVREDIEALTQTADMARALALELEVALAALPNADEEPQ
jgi:hypothetical protein